MLPDIYILTNLVNINVKDERYQYRVTYSIFGEIIKIAEPFLTLPPNAQRLTKGKNTENYLLELKFQKKLLRYKLPLAILDFWKNDEFDPVNKAIAERETELGTDFPNDFLSLISDPWLKDFYLKIKEDIAEKGTGDFWRGLSGLMSHDPVILEKSFRDLRAYSWKLPAAIMGDIWPTLTERSVLRHFYQHAHLYPSPSTAAWLLNALADEGSTFFRGLILRGLAEYKTPTVYQTLLNHYNAQKEMGEGESEILINALSEFDTPAVKKMAWKVLTEKNYFAAKAAHQVLIKQGVYESAIAKKLTSFLLDDQYSDRVNSLLSRFQQLENTALLLSPEQFLTRAAYAVRMHQNVRPQTNLASLLDRTWQSNTLRIIIDFLFHPEPMVRRLGLDQISSLVVQFPKRLMQLNPDTVKRIFQLTGDATEAVSTEAVETIRILVPRLGQSSWILNLLNVRNRNLLLKYLLPAILALHRKQFTELAVVPFCVKNLTHKTVPVRTYSILILQYYRRPEVVAVLEKLRSDREPTIQEALGRGWRDDDDLLKVLR